MKAEVTFKGSPSDLDDIREALDLAASRSEALAKGGPDAPRGIEGAADRRAHAARAMRWRDLLGKLNS